jgi:RsiW-degrading membrane proteinase PrsW (M82 family)
MVELIASYPERSIPRFFGFIWKNAAWAVILAAILIVTGINLFAENALPEDPVRRLDALLGAGMAAEAEPVYRQLLAADPLNLELHFASIQNHFNIPAIKNAGKADSDWAAYYAALSEDPATRDLGLLGLGFIQANQKDFQGALNDYRQVTDRDLKYLNLLTGKAFQELENNHLAEKYYQREIEVGGDVNKAVSDMLNLFLEENQVEKLRALKNDPQLAPFIEPKYQRKLALKTGELSTYLWFTFLKPVQLLSFEGILCALLVGSVWFVYFRRIDVFAGEPVLLSLGMILAGALSALVSLIFSDSLKELLPLSLGQGWVTDLTFTFLHIGLVEETAKFLPVLLVLPLFRRPREPFDLIFYASLSALGFATLENALYFTQHGIGITASRFMFSTIMHLCMTGIVSYAYARALFIRPGRLVPALLAGLAASALVHGLFDFFLLGAGQRFTSFSIFVLLFAAREFYRTVQTALNFSPFFDETQSTSPRLTNYGLLFSATAAFFALVFLFHNSVSSTEIANKQLASLAVISLPTILAAHTSLGRLYLSRDQVVPFMRLSLVHRISAKWSAGKRWSTRPGEVG